MITGIKLKNWRSHSYSEMEFVNGTNALLGHMGSGKTTVLDSICFGLFGTFPNLQSKKIKIDDLIMNKPSIKDMAEVEVSFKINGKTYSVKRVIEKRKGTTYSELREDGKLLEAPSTQRVNEFVERLLKVDYDLFSKAIYSEQNALDYFLTIPKGQRMRRIDELLMIDKFDKARSNTVTLFNKISERKLATESMMSKVNVTDLESNIRNLKSSITMMISEKIQNEKDIRNIKQQRTELDQQLQQMRKMKEDFENLMRDERGLASAIDELSKSLSKFEQKFSKVDRDSLEENLRSSSRLLEEITASLEIQTKDYQALSEKYSKYKTEAEVFKRETIDRLEKELTEKLETQKDVDKLKKRIEEVKHVII